MSNIIQIMSSNSYGAQRKLPKKLKVCIKIIFCSGKYCNRKQTPSETNNVGLLVLRTWVLKILKDKFPAAFSVRFK